MTICIIDYGLGNIASIYNSLELLNQKVIVSSNEKDIKNSTHIILPGVGSFERGMNELYKRDLINILNEQVINNKKPVLGICLGMQLFATQGEEGGVFSGLNCFFRYFSCSSRILSFSNNYSISSIII